MTNPVEHARDVLRDALSMIRDPRYWVQGCEARDGSYKSCDADEDGAEHFCAWGAIVASSPGVEDFPARYKASALLVQQTNYPVYDEDDRNAVICGILNWNDDGERKHGEVVAAFEAAIEGATNAE